MFGTATMPLTKLQFQRFHNSGEVCNFFLQLSVFVQQFVMLGGLLFDEEVLALDLCFQDVNPERQTRHQQNVTQHLPTTQYQHTSATSLFVQLQVFVCDAVVDLK